MWHAVVFALKCFALINILNASAVSTLTDKQRDVNNLSTVSHQPNDGELSVHKISATNNSKINGTLNMKGIKSFSGNSRLRVLPLYTTPFIILFGLIGNIISLRVFVHFLRIHSNSSDLYLCALALFDILTLLFFIVYWANAFLRVELTRRSIKNYVDDVINRWGLCQTWFYFGMIPRYLSVWIIVIFTIERYLYIRNPLTASTQYTVKRACLVVLALVLSVCALCLYKFWSFRQQGEYCKFNRFYYTSTFAELPLLAFIPAVLIILFNTLIVRSLFAIRRENVELGDGLSVASRERQVTCRLIVVSVVFVLLITPFQIFRYYRNISKLSGKKHYSPLFGDVAAVTQFLFFSNNAVNFLLYCVVGSRFRLAALKLCCCKIISEKLSSDNANKNIEDKRNCPRIVGAEKCVTNSTYCTPASSVRQSLLDVRRASNEEARSQHLKPEQLRLMALKINARNINQNTESHA